MAAIENKAEVIAAILADISLGTLVANACQKAGITRKTLHQWCQETKELGDAYARAREMQSHALAEQALAVAHGYDPLTEAREEAIEEATTAYMESHPKHWRKMVSALEASLIQRDRLRVDTLKWLTSKIAPRLYGEKLEVSGPEGGPVPVALVGWQFGDRRIDFPSG